MQAIIADVMRLEKVLEKINSTTEEVQTKDYPLNQAVAAMFDALDMLKERAGLTDNGWREAA